MRKCIETLKLSEFTSEFCLDMLYRKLNMGTMNMELWCPIFTGVRNAHCARERKTDDDLRVETKEERREWNEFLFNLPWLRGSDVILVTPPFHLLLVIYLGNWIRPKFEFGHMWPSPYKTEEKKNEFSILFGAWKHRRTSVIF